MKKGLITSILALTFGSLQAQPLPPSPKLVVTLTIDQLRTDYMEAFSSLYGEKGFKRLLREGKVFRQADFQRVHGCIHLLNYGNWRNSLFIKDIRLLYILVFIFRFQAA